MIFLLGVFSAGLVSLLLLPAISRRAMRLSRRRLELLLPLSMDEVVAERDLLRAEFAAERRRLEQKMETEATAQALQMAELGRRATEIVTLNGYLSQLRGEHADLSLRHAVATRELAEANGERGALITELHDAAGLYETTRARHEELGRAHAALLALADERRSAIAGLETRVEGLVARIEGLDRDLEALARKAKYEEERALGLGEERDMVLKEMRAVEQLMAATQARFESERERAAGFQHALDTQRMEADATRALLREAQKASEAAERARLTAEDDARNVSRRLAGQMDSARAAEESGAAQTERLRAEVAALRGALKVARGAQAGRSSAETEKLRAAIADIGAKVAQMADADVRL